MRLFIKKALLIPLVLLLTGMAVMAQTRVTGTVKDGSTGEMLIGATIKEKNVSNGAITDVEGRFVLTVASPNATLVVNYTGYSELEIPLNGSTDVTIDLSDNNNLINEVVVIGYGTQRKSDLTGAIGTVKAKDIEKIPTASVEQALQGKVAGVYVSPASGEPGRGATIRIRGTGTLNNASPLYVVDGMLLDDITFLNPQDVASIEVLKDASATAIYGNRGSNGVILITTKQGTGNTRPVVSLSTSYGSQSIARKLPLANAAQFAEMYNELKGNNYFPDPAALGTGTDWQDGVFQTAPMGNIQLGVAGMKKKFAYNVSGNYFNQEGILKETGFKRMTGRFNGDYAVHKQVKIGANLALSNELRDNVGGGVISGIYRMPPVFAPYDSTGDFTDPTFFGQSIGNPAADLFYKNDNTTRVRRYVGTVYATWNLYKYFTLKTNFGFDRRNEHFYNFEPIFEVSSSQLNNLERTTRDTVKERTWLLENTLNFDRAWDKMRIGAVVGQTAQEYTYFKRNVVNEVLQPNGEQRRDRAMISYLSRVNAVFFDRYLVTASLRADGSSRFSRDNRWGYFPSAAVGWNVAQEPFMQGQKIFDRLKFRASWGVTGNDKIQDYPSLGIISDELYASFNDTVQTGATLVNYANADIRWETTEQTDIGLELALFKGRLSAEIDWYRRFTYDILSDLPIPDYVGSGSNPFVNAAQVENTGWDMTLQWRESRRKWGYNFTAIYSPVKNKVLQLNEGKSEIFDGRTAQGDFATRTIVGQPIGAFYGYQTAGIFQNEEEIASSPVFGNEQPGDFKFADLNGDGKLDGQDRTFLGSPIPTLTYGFSAGFDAFGFDVSADFFGVQGNKVVNAKAVARFDTPNWETLWYENRWTGEGTSNTVPRVTNGGHNYRMSDFLLEDGSFLRLRSIVLGYTLPKQPAKKIGLSHARVYISGTNLWTRQSYSGFTPEFPNDSVFRAGMDFLNYPMAKMMNFGLDVRF